MWLALLPPCPPCSDSKYPYVGTGGSCSRAKIGVSAGVWGVPPAPAPRARRAPPHPGRDPCFCLPPSLLGRQAALLAREVYSPTPAAPSPTTSGFVRVASNNVEALKAAVQLAPVAVYIRVEPGECLKL